MPSAKKAYVSDGVNWLPLVSGLPDIAGLATVAYVDGQLVGVVTPYLTISSASTIYLTQASGLTQASASTIYLTQSSASTTYLTQSSGLTQASASTIYLTQSSASTTYATTAALNNINGESDQFILPSQIFG